MRERQRETERQEEYLILCLWKYCSLLSRQKRKIYNEFDCVIVFGENMTEDWKWWIEKRNSQMLKAGTEWITLLKRKNVGAIELMKNDSVQRETTNLHRLKCTKMKPQYLWTRALLSRPGGRIRSQTLFSSDCNVEPKSRGPTNTHARPIMSQSMLSIVMFHPVK